MTSDETTFSLDLAGRSILFKRAKPGQLLMLQRLLEGLRSKMDTAASDTERGNLFIRLNKHSLDMIESLVVQPEDVEFLQEKMLLGVLDVEDLRPVLSGGKTPEAVPDDAPPKKRAPRKPPHKATVQRKKP